MEEEVSGRSRILKTVGKVLGAIAGVLALGAGAVVVVLLLGLHFAGSSMNAGPFVVDSVDATYEISVRDGLAIDGASGAGAVALKTALESRCQPMGNGINVLFQHAWYNTITDGYDARLWLEPSDGYGDYGLYIWGNNVFFRDEDSYNGYVNRVLTCDLDVGGWNTLLAPFAVPQS
jgi:hypothetical protein